MLEPAAGRKTPVYSRGPARLEDEALFSGFREFIMRGNVVDLAVAVVIGAAFGAVITSFVGDVLTPLLGVFGLPEFETLSVTVGKAEVRYGAFLNALFSFLLVAIAIYFFIIQPLNALEARRQRGKEETPTTKTCTECASEIPAVARRCPMCTEPQLSA